MHTDDVLCTLMIISSEIFTHKLVTLDSLRVAHIERDAHLLNAGLSRRPVIRRARSISAAAAV
jgi:hypothetical protein